MIQQNIFPDTLRILYLEDKPEDFRLFRQYLKDTLSLNIHETEIAWCATLGQALEVLQFQSFHVVITSLNLPDAIGIEAVNGIMEQHPEQCLMVLTEYDSEEMSLECIRQGAQDFLSKNALNRYTLGTAILQGWNRHKIRLGLMHYISEMPVAV